MREEIKKQENAQTLQELQLLFSIKDDLDKRRYNCQQSNEVAAIFSTTADGDIPDAYVVVRNKNTKELKKISTMDPKVDSSVYPLFNPYGQKGWHENIAKKNSEGNVSRAAYTKYNIAIRDNFNPLLRGRRLFQQYVVDTYVKIEKDRIEYCKSHQDVLKVSSYKSLIEYVKKKAQGLENARVGHNAASVVITNNDEGTIVNHDEIKTYINARYVGPSEAVWRILSKPLHDKSHVIIRLPVHLPNYHNVVIHTDPHIEDAESALN
ncbi:hypothetical protein TKK_0016682 [Trichogramma kaykai]